MSGRLVAASWRCAICTVFVSLTVLCSGLLGGGTASAAGCPPADGDAYSTAVLQSDPVAYYRIDESSGPTMCDSSTSANNGTYGTSGLTYGVSGALSNSSDTAVGSAGDQVGTSAAGSGITGGSPFTLEGWFRSTGTVQNQALVDIGEAGKGNIVGLTTWSDASDGSCGATEASMLGLDEDGTSNCWNTGSVGINLYDGAWHYLAVVSTGKGGTVTGYVDGKSLGSQTPSTPLDLTSTDIRVGYWVNQSLNHYLDGDIDEVAVYRSALSAATILAHYDDAGPVVSGVSPISGPAAGGSTVTISGHGFTGATAVDFGGDPAGGLTIDSDAQITVTAPAGSGTVPVTVLTPSGRSAIISSISEFTYAVPSATTPSQLPPKNAAPPRISGVPEAGRTLGCSRGRWTGAAADYEYQWSRDGTPIAGATKSSYRVRADDEQLSLTCAVTVFNPAGGDSTVASSRIEVPVPIVKGCPAATGDLNGQSLGPVKLDGTLTQAHRAFSRSTYRSEDSADLFCLTPAGVDVAYPSNRLLSALSARERKQLHGRVVWASTANAFYSIKGVRVGAPLAQVLRTLRVTAVFHDRETYWYLAPNGSSTAVLEVRGGVVQQVAIANKALTKTRASALSLLRTSLNIRAITIERGIPVEAGLCGSAAGTPPDSPVIGIGATRDSEGYWEAAADGGIAAFGDASFYGSTAGIPLNSPVVGVAGTPDGRGYWMVAADGGIFAFGDAGFYGSAGGLASNSPIVGIASTPDGRGYWMVAADGGTFAFGDAGFYGSASRTSSLDAGVGIASIRSWY
jgi:hypothetical protein